MAAAALGGICRLKIGGICGMVRLERKQWLCLCSLLSLLEG